MAKIHREQWLRPPNSASFVCTHLACIKEVVNYYRCQDDKGEKKKKGLKN